MVHRVGPAVSAGRQHGNCQIHLGRLGCAVSSGNAQLAPVFRYADIVSAVVSGSVQGMILIQECAVPRFTVGCGFILQAARLIRIDVSVRELGGKLVRAECGCFLCNFQVISPVNGAVGPHHRRIHLNQVGIFMIYARYQHTVTLYGIILAFMLDNHHVPGFGWFGSVQEIQAHPVIVADAAVAAYGIPAESCSAPALPVVQRKGSTGRMPVADPVIAAVLFNRQFLRFPAQEAVRFPALSAAVLQVDIQFRLGFGIDGVNVILSGCPCRYKIILGRLAGLVGFSDQPRGGIQCRCGQVIAVTADGRDFAVQVVDLIGRIGNHTVNRERIRLELDVCFGHFDAFNDVCRFFAKVHNGHGFRIHRHIIHCDGNGHRSGRFYFFAIHTDLNIEEMRSADISGIQRQHGFCAECFIFRIIRGNLRCAQLRVIRNP